MGDIGPALELNNLNIQMGMMGIYLGGCQLYFYSRVIVYAVTFGPSGSFSIEKFNRFVGVWEAVMFSGTMEQTTNSLNSFGPFLTVDEVMAYWGGFKLPPEPNITEALEEDYPV